MHQAADEFRGQSMALQERKVARRKSLGPNITRLDSGSLRVRIRRDGQEIKKFFPLYGNSPDQRERQELEARTFRDATLRNLLNGTHVDVSQIEDLTLGDLLRTFRDKGMGDSKKKNAQKDRNRIEQILKDDISVVRILSLETVRLAAYRDELIERFKEKDRRRKERDQIRALAAGEISAPISAETEDEKGPARTTLLNKLGLITRALHYGRENIHRSIPSVALPRLPLATPGRDRRISEDELKAILRVGGEVDPVIPHAVQFAIATALRKERILEFKENLVVDVGSGHGVIKYPRGAKREKGVGVIPVTRELRMIIKAAKEQLNISDRNERLFQIGEARFDNVWQETMAKGGITGLHFHDLRHEATSRLFERGLGMMEVMSITGHSTTEMVKRYSHFSAIKIIEKLDGSGDIAPLKEELSRLLNSFLLSGGGESELQELVDSTIAELEGAE